VTKPLRRLLRQLGSGSLAAGVAALVPDSRPLAQAAALLEVEEGVLAAEAARVRRESVWLWRWGKSQEGPPNSLSQICQQGRIGCQ
jgi:hypothetical protein